MNDFFMTHDIIPLLCGSMYCMKYQYIVGIDEVGRGSVAGPVYVCGVLIECELLDEIVSGSQDSLRDSKKLTEKMRLRWFEYLKKLKQEKKISYHIASLPARVVDAYGINPSIQTCIDGVLKKLIPESIRDKTLVMLDGGLSAPVAYPQETQIRGDENIPSIGLASIIAKVSRDEYMTRLNSSYPQYEFSNHKGYGTKKHMELIQKYGPCEEHRLSFLKKILDT